MLTTAQRWGNSLVFRIPKALAESVQLRVGSVVEITLDGDGLRIRPVASGQPTLADLLSQISDENLHREADIGAQTGREVW